MQLLPWIMSTHPTGMLCTLLSWDTRTNHGDQRYQSASHAETVRAGPSSEPRRATGRAKVLSSVSPITAAAVGELTHRAPCNVKGAARAEGNTRRRAAFNARAVVGSAPWRCASCKVFYKRCALAQSLLLKNPRTIQDPGYN